MPLVKFIKENKEIEVPARRQSPQGGDQGGHQRPSGRQRLRRAINKFLNCHGFGQCGTCRVKITKGMENASPMGFMEKIRFYNPLPDPIPCMAFVGNEDTMRLACQTLVLWRHGSRNRPAAESVRREFL